MPVSVTGPEPTPGPPGEGFYGDRAEATKHIRSIPQLVHRILADLPNSIASMEFSAVVYRYEFAAPWIVDVFVSGVHPDDLDDRWRCELLIRAFIEEVERYNWADSNVIRFAGPNVVLLRPEERGHRPGRVTVRRYYLRRVAPTMCDRLRDAVRGLLTRWVI